MAVLTPWGPAQHQKKLADGITWYSTAGHGGFGVSRERLAEMPEALRLRPGPGDCAWYEEDCNWSLVALAFPDLFSEEDRAAAVRTAKSWRPDEYEAWSGETIPPGESYLKDEAAFKREHAEDYVAISAFGDWHDAVPEGMVAVLASKGGRRDPGLPGKWFLVPRDEYSAFRFVVDPERHAEIEPLR